MRLGFLLAALASVIAGTSWAMPEVPVESSRALGVTRGKSFKSGLVFVDGKYLAPPYQVERWGTGIRINGKPVTGPIIPWTEFMKTQSGVKVTKSETPVEPAATPTPAPEPEPEPVVAEDESETSLDDLFDDDPKPKKKKTPPKKKSSVRRPVVRKPVTTVSYSLDGDFVPNEASKALVAKINAVRTEIDRTLRAGGFICFGERYSRVSGDAHAAQRILDVVPELLQHAESPESFASGVRAANLFYLSQDLCADLFRNRIDYRRLQERRAQVRKEKEWQKLLNETGVQAQPLL